MANKTPKTWEIWFANVKFEDDPEQVKARPVLIISNKVAYILSLKVTSKQPRSNYWGEYSLIKWKEAGLSKPSTVRISKKLRLVEKDLLRRTGRISSIDILNIMKIMNNN